MHVETKLIAQHLFNFQVFNFVTLIYISLYQLMNTHKNRYKLSVGQKKKDTKLSVYNELS